MPFKAALKEQYTQWMATGEHEFMPTGKIKQPDTEQLCEWIRSMGMHFARFDRF
jgi:hypothetical protein